MAQSYTIPRWIKWTAGSVAALVVTFLAAAFFVKEPLRQYAERSLNKALVGYSFHIGGLALHPFSLSMDLDAVVVRQEVHPDPPLITVPEIVLDARLAPLLGGKVVAEVRLHDPVVSLTQQQMKAVSQKTEQEVAQIEPSWQKQIRDMVPFEAELFIQHGEMRYAGQPAAEPIRLTAIDIAARHLTNRPEHDHLYPSELTVKTTLFDDAQLEINGHADLLAMPHPAFEGDMRLSELDVRPVLTALGQSETPVKAGRVEMAAHVEYAASRRAITFERVAIREPKIDYAAHPESSKIRTDVQETAVEADAWQDRLTSLLPVLIKEASIQNGEVIYRPRVDGNTIRLHHLDAVATNIHNHPSETPEYPSGIRVAVRLEQSSEITLEGRADFFARPLPSIDAHMEVKNLRLAGLHDLAKPFNVQLRKGTLDISGRVNYSNTKAKLLLDRFLLKDANIDYVHRSATKAKEAARAKQVAKAAQKAHRDPAIQVRIERGQVLNSEMGFVNRAASPDYRIYMADLNADMDNFSTKPEVGTGAVKVTGKFMGSGPTMVKGTFRPEKPHPDFNLAVKIMKTDVTTFNDVLRAYGNVDAHRGKFALFSELKVKNNRIDGYVKPMFREVEVYDPEKDQDKALSSKIYEAVVGGVMSLLENTPRDEVATKSDVSGPVENPQANTWQIIRKLVQNAFFNAILPGFEGDA